MSFIQAILIGLVAALTQFEGGWLGEAKFREPVVTGFLVGLVLNDVQKGLLIGAQLQLIWMGATGIGPTAQLDIGTGGTIGAAVAIMTGQGAETAIVFGLPVAVIMQFLNMMLMTSYSGLMQKVDRDIEAGHYASINRIHYLCGFLSFFMYFFLTFIVMYFGNNAITAIVESLPEWAHKGLNAVAALLPALGFALLLNIIMETSLVPYFILGYVPAAFVGTDLNMVGIGAMAFALAWIIFDLKSSSGQMVIAPSVDDNEWED